MLQCKTCLNRYDRMWHENGKGISRPPDRWPPKYMGTDEVYGFIYLVCDMGLRGYSYTSSVSVVNDIILLHGTEYFLIDGDFNAKHCIWNNLNSNANGLAIKNYSKFQDYQIIHSPTYIHRQPNCTPNNIPISTNNITFSSST